MGTRWEQPDTYPASWTLGRHYIHSGAGRRTDSVSEAKEHRFLMPFLVSEHVTKADRHIEVAQSAHSENLTEIGKST